MQLKKKPLERLIDKTIYLILDTKLIIILVIIAFFMKISGYDPLKKKIKNVKTFKDYKKNQKIDLTRIF